MFRSVFAGLIVAVLMTASSYWFFSNSAGDLLPSISPEQDREDGSSAFVPASDGVELSSDLLDGLASPVPVPRQSEMCAEFELQDLSSVQIGEVFSFYLVLENRNITLIASEVRQTRAGNRVIG